MEMFGSLTSLSSNNGSDYKYAHADVSFRWTYVQKFIFLHRVSCYDVNP